MAETVLRPAVAGDLAALAELWQTAFHDPAPLVRRMLTEGGLLSAAMVAELDGHAVSAMYAFPGLTLCGRRAAYLYALSTLPHHRGRGLGAAVLDAIARRCFAGGAELVVLCPADAGLARWYGTLGWTPLCTMADAALSRSDAAPGTCTPIAWDDYAAQRRDPAAVPPALLLAQSIVLEAEGGGFFLLTLSRGTALACAVPRADGLLVLELQCAPTEQDAALQTLSRYFSIPRLRLRGPGPGPHTLLCRSAAAAVPAPTELCFPFLMD